MITIDELIEKLQDARNKTPLGGNVVVCLCEDDREYVSFTEAKLDADKDGAIFILVI